MNGNGPLSAGRAIGGLAVGRAVQPLMSSWAGGSAFPLTSGVCGPVPQCCCVGPWNIKPGETQPLALQWQRWIDSVPGYVLHKVLDASLYDMTVNPPVPADPEIIKVISTDYDNEGDDIDNADVGDMIELLPPYVTHTRVEVGLEARIGSQFRLNLAVAARDCDGRRIVMRDCVVIVVSEC